MKKKYYDDFPFTKMQVYYTAENLGIEKRLDKSGVNNSHKRYFYTDEYNKIIKVLSKPKKQSYYKCVECGGGHLKYQNRLCLQCKQKAKHYKPISEQIKEYFYEKRR